MLDIHAVKILKFDVCAVNILLQICAVNLVFDISVINLLMFDISAGNLLTFDRSAVNILTFDRSAVNILTFDRSAVNILTFDRSAVNILMSGICAVNILILGFSVVNILVLCRFSDAGLIQEGVDSHVKRHLEQTSHHSTACLAESQTSQPPPANPMSSESRGSEDVSRSQRASSEYQTLKCDREMATDEETMRSNACAVMLQYSAEGGRKYRVFLRVHGLEAAVQRYRICLVMCVCVGGGLCTYLYVHVCRYVLCVVVFCPDVTY